MFIDLDDFKKVNDLYGHDVGDLLLIEVAETISKNLRKKDFILKYNLPHNSIPAARKGLSEPLCAIIAKEVAV